MKRYVDAVMREGMSFVCAHCNNFWWSYARGLEKCKAGHEGRDCAGPGKFMAFPEYDGPLKGNLHKCCFVCGKEPSHTVAIPIGLGMVRNIGVCDKDREILLDFRVSKLMPVERPRHKLNKRGIQCPIILPKN